MRCGELLGEVVGHMEWADAAVWRSVLTSEVARGDAALIGRLRHLHGVQAAFLGMWRGEPTGGAADGMNAAELAAWSRLYYPAASAHLAARSEEDFDAPVNVPWTRQVAEQLGFEPAATSLAQTVLQVWSHTAHHRGQVTMRLRELGITPPLVDYIAWVWQGRPAAAWP